MLLLLLSISDDVLWEENAVMDNHNCGADIQLCNYKFLREKGIS